MFQENGDNEKRIDSKMHFRKIQINLYNIYIQMSTSSQKWNISLFSVLIFLLVVNPYTYGLTDYIFRSFLGRISVGGCPTTLGLLLHAIVYLLLVRYSMDLNIDFK